MSCQDEEKLDYKTEMWDQNSLPQQKKIIIKENYSAL